VFAGDASCLVTICQDLMNHVECELHEAVRTRQNSFVKPVYQKHRAIASVMSLIRAVSTVPLRLPPQARTVRHGAPLLRTFFSNAAPKSRPLAPRNLHASQRRATFPLNIPYLRNLVHRRFRGLRFNSSQAPKPNPTPHLGSPESPPSLSERLRKLSRDYGWAALAVYLGLSVLDFPLCFLLVRALGTERIGRLEHAIVEGFWAVIGTPFPSVRDRWDQWRNKSKEQVQDVVSEATVREGEVAVGDNTLEVAQRSARGETASTYSLECPLTALQFQTLCFTRSLDGNTPRLRHPQNPRYLDTRSVSGCHNAQDSEGFEGQRMEDWKDETKEMSISGGQGCVSNTTGVG